MSVLLELYSTNGIARIVPGSAQAPCRIRSSSFLLFVVLSFWVMLRQNTGREEDEDDSDMASFVRPQKRAQTLQSGIFANELPRLPIE
jgi:hypothetical protein